MGNLGWREEGRKEWLMKGGIEGEGGGEFVFFFCSYCVYVCVCGWVRVAKEQVQSTSRLYGTIHDPIRSDILVISFHVILFIYPIYLSVNSSINQSINRHIPSFPSFPFHSTPILVSHRATHPTPCHHATDFKPPQPTQPTLSTQKSTYSTLVLSS